MPDNPTTTSTTKTTTTSTTSTTTSTTTTTTPTSTTTTTKEFTVPITTTPPSTSSSSSSSSSSTSTSTSTSTTSTTTPTTTTTTLTTTTTTKNVDGTTNTTRTTTPAVVITDPTTGETTVVATTPTGSAEVTTINPDGTTDTDIVPTNSQSGGGNSTATTTAAVVGAVGVVVLIISAVILKRHLDKKKREAAFADAKALRTIGIIPNDRTAFEAAQIEYAEHLTNFSEGREGQSLAFIGIGETISDEDREFIIAQRANKIDSFLAAQKKKIHKGSKPINPLNEITIDQYKQLEDWGKAFKEAAKVEDSVYALVNGKLNKLYQEKEDELKHMQQTSGQKPEGFKGNDYFVNELGLIPHPEGGIAESFYNSVFQHKVDLLRLSEPQQSGFEHVEVAIHHAPSGRQFTPQEVAAEKKYIDKSGVANPSQDRALLPVRKDETVIVIEQDYEIPVQEDYVVPQPVNLLESYKDRISSNDLVKTHFNTACQINEAIQEVAKTLAEERLGAAKQRCDQRLKDIHQAVLTTQKAINVEYNKLRGFDEEQSIVIELNDFTHDALKQAFEEVDPTKNSEHTKNALRLALDLERLEESTKERLVTLTKDEQTQVEWLQDDLQRARLYAAEYQDHEKVYEYFDRQKSDFKEKKLQDAERKKPTRQYQVSTLPKEIQTIEMTDNPLHGHGWNPHIYETGNATLHAWDPQNYDTGDHQQHTYAAVAHKPWDAGNYEIGGESTGWSEQNYAIGSAASQPKYTAVNQGKKKEGLYALASSTNVDEDRSEEDEIYDMGNDGYLQVHPNQVYDTATDRPPSPDFKTNKSEKQNAETLKKGKGKTK